MKRHMKTLMMAIALCLAVVAPAFSAPCKYTGAKDVAGATMCYSPSAEGKIRDVPFNVSDLPKAHVTSIKTNLRNNAVQNWRIGLNENDGSRSWIVGQVPPTFFSIASSQHVASPENMRKSIARSKGATGATRNERTIKQYDHLATAMEYETVSGQWCIAGIAAFDAYDMDRFKQILRIRDCTGRRSVDEVFGWLKALRAVEAGYNG